MGTLRKHTALVEGEVDVACPPVADNASTLGGDGFAFVGFCCFAAACQLYDNVVLLENANLYNGLLYNVLAQVAMLAVLALAGIASSWEPPRPFALASALLASGGMAFGIFCPEQVACMVGSAIGGAATASLAVCWGCFLGRRPPDQLCLRIVSGLFAGSAIAFVLFSAGTPAVSAGALVVVLACSGLPWLYVPSGNRAAIRDGAFPEPSDFGADSPSPRDPGFSVSALMLITLVACSLLSSFFSGLTINPYGVQSKLIDSYMHLITTVSFGLLAADCIVAKTLNVQGFTLAALAALLVGLLTLSTSVMGGVVVPVGLILAVRGLSWGLGWVVLVALSCANHTRRLAVVSIGLLLVGGAIGRGIGVLMSNGSAIDFAGLGVFGAFCITLVALAYAVLNATGLTSVSVPIGFALRAGRRTEPGRKAGGGAVESQQDDAGKAYAGPSTSSGFAMSDASPLPSSREFDYLSQGSLHEAGDRKSGARLADASALLGVHGGASAYSDAHHGTDGISSADFASHSRDAAAYRLELLGPISLTDKEIEVAVLLLGGVVYTDIAERLGISVSTVKYHAKNIYTKAGVETKREFLRKYAP